MSDNPPQKNSKSFEPCRAWLYMDEGCVDVMVTSTAEPAMHSAVGANRSRFWIKFNNGARELVSGWRVLKINACNKAILDQITEFRKQLATIDKKIAEEIRKLQCIDDQDGK